MNKLLFIAVFGISILSMANCGVYTRDLIVSGDRNYDYNGLNVRGSYVVSGSGDMTVFGDATIDENLIHSGTGNIHVTGRLLVKGKIAGSGTGALTADGGIFNYNQ